MKKLPLVVAAVVVVILIYGGYLLFKDSTGPLVELTPEAAFANRNDGVTVTVSDPSGIRSVRIVARTDAAEQVVLEQSFTEKSQEQSIKVPLTAVTFPDGPFVLHATVYDASFAGFGKGNATEIQWGLIFDATAPRISIKSPQPYVRRGGTGSVRYAVNEETAETGVIIQDRLFKGFQQEDGDYIVFFPFPYTLTPEEFMPEITATDMAGNTTSGALGINALNRTFRTDRINLNDSFLSRKSVEFAAEVPGDMTPLDRYLAVNSQLRIRDEGVLVSVSEDTVPTMLWQDAFMQLPKSQVRAGFADHRTYYYTNTPVDEQYHMGLDLASVVHAPVPAANAGRVVFADYQGIFGNLVIIDHGLGLQSLYSHLSEISVEKGAEVQKGDTIGKTGVTGLAGGDHLHFGMTVGGIQVQPLEWLDPKWIRDNVTSRLNQE